MCARESDDQSNIRRWTKSQRDGARKKEIEADSEGEKERDGQSVMEKGRWKRR